MANDYYGSLDFTVLCRLWKQHKELFRMVDFKDGQHALLNVNFCERQQPDEHGNTHYMKANCKKADQREGVNYYVGSSFKPSTHSQQTALTAAPQQQNAPADDSELPF